MRRPGAIPAFSFEWISKFLGGADLKLPASRRRNVIMAACPCQPGFQAGGDEGFAFDAPAELMRDFSRRAGPGYWRCDIAEGERLSWSDDVYELFGLRAGTPVERGWAVDRYTPESRERLARVRDHALRRGLGFMLDAEIDPAVGRQRWIRIFAVPVVDRAGRAVQLQGMKRQL